MTDAPSAAGIPSGPRWLSYREAADLWRVTPEAAAARIRRARWPKRTRNSDGAAEALIPSEATAPPTRPEKPAQRRPSATVEAPPPAPAVDLAAALAPLITALDRETADRRTLQQQSDALREDLHAARVETATAKGDAALERQRREAAEAQAADLRRRLAEVEAQAARRWRWRW
jgi:hypothetical protein